MNKPLQDYENRFFDLHYDQLLDNFNTDNTRYDNSGK